jgi:hypothetical protein
MMPTSPVSIRLHIAQSDSNMIKGRVDVSERQWITQESRFFVDNVEALKNAVWTRTKSIWCLWVDVQDECRNGYEEDWIE